MKILQNTLPPGRIAGRAAFLLREYFFPFGCAVCGASLLGADEAWYGLCESCRAGIDAGLSAAGERCNLCGRPLISEEGRCLSCRGGNATDDREGAAGLPAAVEVGACDRAIVLFPYTGKYRRLLGAYKFDRSLALGHFFTEKTVEALENNFGPDDPYTVVPVPPRPGKIQKPGWDQVEYLARLLNRKQIPVLRCLKRLPSKVQKELGREDRKKNLRGRIILAGRPPAAIPKTVVVLDDVMTTGSTLEVCAEALKAGGAERVYGLCLFYD
jgi:ComF family protein